MNGENAFGRGQRPTHGVFNDAFEDNGLSFRMRVLHVGADGASDAVALDGQKERVIWAPPQRRGVHGL